jgi:hypothetical protein
MRKNSFAGPDGRRKGKSSTSRLGGIGAFACQRLFLRVGFGTFARFLTVAARERGCVLFSSVRRDECVRYIGVPAGSRRQVGDLPH